VKLRKRKNQLSRTGPEYNDSQIFKPTYLVVPVIALKREKNNYIFLCCRYGVQDYYPRKKVL